MSLRDKGYSKKHFCHLDDFFADLDHLENECLNLEGGNFSSTALKIQNNINPISHNDRTELHALKLVYKKTIPHLHRTQMYYGIGFKLIADDHNDKFILDKIPTIYSFTVREDKCVGFSYQDTFNTYTSFCNTLPIVINCLGVAHPPSLLNREDGDFLQVLFKSAEKNRDLYQKQAAHVLDFFRKGILNGKTINAGLIEIALQDFLQSFDLYRTCNRQLLNACIAKEVAAIKPENTRDKIRRIVRIIAHDALLLNHFFELVSTPNPSNYKPTHQQTMFCECRACSFGQSIELSNFNAEMENYVGLSVLDPEQYPELPRYIAHPSPATKYALMDAIDSRLVVPRKDRNMAITLNPNDYTLIENEDELSLFSAMTERFHELMPFFDYTPYKPHQSAPSNKSASSDTETNMIEIVGTTKVFSTQPKQDITDTASAIETDHIGVELETLIEPNQEVTTTNIDNSDAETSERLDEETATLLEESTDIDIQAQSEVIEEPAPTIFTQHKFNEIHKILEEDLNLPQTISGSKRCSDIDMDSLNILPFHFKVYDKDTKSYGIHTHVMSLIFKEYFTKDKKEEGMINYLGFGHELLFDGEKFIISSQTNIYAVHQRKKKLVSVALVEYLNFLFDKPLNLPLDAKQILAPLPNSTATPKKLLEFVTKNRAVFHETGKQIAHMLNEGYNQYLYDSNRTPCENSALRFLEYKTKDIENLSLSSITMDYKSEIAPPVVEEEPVELKQVVPNTVQVDSKFIHTDVVQVGDDKKKINIFVEPTEISLPEPVTSAVSADSLPVIQYIHTNPPKNIQQDIPKNFSTVAATPLITTNDQSQAEPQEPVIEIPTEIVVQNEQASEQPLISDAEIEPFVAVPAEPVAIEVAEPVAIEQPSSVTSINLFKGDAHPLLNRILLNQPLADLSKAKSWEYETNFDVRLIILLTKNNIAFRIADCDAEPVIFDLDNFVEKQGHYQVFIQMTNKKTAKLIRKFVKQQLELDLFNSFKSI